MQKDHFISLNNTIYQLETFQSRKNRMGTFILQIKYNTKLSTKEVKNL